MYALCLYVLPSLLLHFYFNPSLLTKILHFYVIESVVFLSYFFLKFFFLILLYCFNSSNDINSLKNKFCLYASSSVISLIFSSLIYSEISEYGYIFTFSKILSNFYPI